MTATVAVGLAFTILSVLLVVVLAAAGPSEQKDPDSLIVQTCFAIAIFVSFVANIVMLMGELL